MTLARHDHASGEAKVNTLQTVPSRTVWLALAAFAVVGVPRQRPNTQPQPPALAASRQAADRAARARELDSLAMSVWREEDRGYAIASGLFFQDPEDAEGTRSGFYLSSIKLFRLAVGADSTNAEAIYHLGQLLCRKSYSGSGTWDKRLLQEGVRRLQVASRKAVGRFASLRPEIEGDLVRELHNLSQFN